EDPPTCANCGGAHTANNANCPVFRKETRNRRAGTIARTASTARAYPPTAHALEADAPGSLMAVANQPRQPVKRRRKRGKRAQARQGALPAAPPTATRAAAPAALQPTERSTKSSKPTVVAAPAGGTKAKRVTPLDPRLTKVISTLNHVLMARSSVTLFR
ncbi:unnamed protein product, partial [Leptidea sinapis]